MILFAATGLGDREAEMYVGALAAALGGERVHIHGVDEFAPEAISYAVTWRPEQGLLATLPNLAAVFNLGAGVDALLGDPTLPDVPVVRYVDDDLTIRMGEWITLQVLTHHRKAIAYLAQQREGLWAERATPAASEVRVGIMGFGVLGAHAAKILVALGFDVAAYARSAREAEVPLFSGDQLGAFLARTDMLVVLLPLTDETRGILNATLFARLPRTAHGPVLINAGRGKLQVEADIVEAITDGTLQGASLDVFEREPLPPESALWRLPNVIVTPHVAAVTGADALARSIAGAITAHRAGGPLRNVVSRDRMY